MNRTFSSILILAFCCCLAVSVTGCGQRGPLYLPEKEPPQQDSETESESESEETSEENNETNS